MFIGSGQVGALRIGADEVARVYLGADLVWSGLASLSIDTLTFTRGAEGFGPSIFTEVSSTGAVTPDFTLFWATRSVGAALSKAEIENGTGNALDNGSITASTITGLDGAITLATSLTDGAIDVFVRDSTAGTPVESAVASATGITIDTVAPVLSTAEIGTVDDTSLIVTLDKAAWGSTSVANWTVKVGGTPITVSALLFIPGNATVDLTVTPPIIGQDVVTVSYSGTGLVGRDGAVVATITDAALRTAATAANALGPFSFTQDSAITNQDLSADFTLNGNTLTYTVSPSLPAGLSLASNGILSGTPTTLQDATSYTVTGQDEYGRETDSTFTIAVVVDVPAGAIKQRDASYILDRNGNYIEVRA